jgi:hypothetical protein
MLGYSDRVARGEAHPGEDALDGGLAELPTDATLFVGGYGHLKEDESHRAHVAKQVAIGVGIAVLIAATICLLVFAARGGGGGGGGGSALAGLGKVAASGARVAASAARVGAEVGFHAARIGLHALPRDLPSPGGGCGEDDPCATRSLADPAWATQQAPPLEAQAAPPGSANFLALGAVLVDNATGRILWASAQNMPIDPVDPRELRQATEHLLAALPPAH